MRYTKKYGKCCADCLPKGGAHSCFCHQMQWLEKQSKGKGEYLVVNKNDWRFINKFFKSTGFKYADEAIKNNEIPLRNEIKH